jgi:hypothetical protein
MGLMAMFEYLFKDLKSNCTGKLREELETREYQSKPDDNPNIKLCAWLQRNSLGSLLQTKDS